MLPTRFLNDDRIECGCDEAGRGCLAGPVVAAAVILPPQFCHPVLNDSKKLSNRQRYELRCYIETHALAWAVAEASVEEIDNINILHAAFLAMHRAIDNLSVLPDRLLIDGNLFDPHPAEISHHCIIRGDMRYAPIAAASVLAKTYRDDLMIGLAVDYPEYNWSTNKGYPTPAHKAAVRINGRCPLHRKSFAVRL